MTLILKESGLALFFREYLMIAWSISNVVTGEQTKELISDGGRKSLKVETEVDCRFFASFAPTVLKYLLKSSAIDTGSVMILSSTIILLIRLPFERQFLFRLK